MGATLRPQGRSHEAGGQEPPRLPLRWAVILLTAGVVGLFTGQGAGPIAAAGLAITTVGLLHKILP